MSELSDSAKVKLVWPIAGFFVVVAFGVGLISMAAFGSENRQDLAAAPASAASPGDPVGIELGDLYIKPDVVEVAAGTVTFNVQNAGSAQHNFAIVDAGVRTPMLDGGT